MRMKYSDCLLFTWSVCVMRRRRRSRRCLEHHESPNTPITANRTQAAATVDGAYIENLKSAPAKPQSVTLSICVLSYSCCCCCCCCCCHSRKHDVSHTEKRGVLWLKPEMCRNDFYVPIPSRSHFHSHSRPWKVLDYIPIPIYSREVIPITSHSHSHWNKKSLKTLIVVHGEEWFKLEWAHKIIHYYSTLVTSYTLMKWKWHARLNLNVM